MSVTIEVEFKVALCILTSSFVDTYNYRGDTEGRNTPAL